MASNEFTIHEALIAGTEVLSRFSFDNPEMEARFLLSGLLKIPLTDFFINPDRTMTTEQVQRFKLMVERRSQQEPVSYIVGRHEFMGVHLQVDPRVLIPRPETEILVEEALEWISNRKIEHPRILDMCTGSGCVSIALAQSLPDAQIVGVDVCPNALSLAKENGKSFKNISFFKSDLFQRWPEESLGLFDMIVANPPYISQSEMKELEVDVTYEPALALDGGPDGLKIISRLVKEAPHYIREDGLLIMEIGYQQGMKVERLFDAVGFKNIEVIKDYQGHDRIVKGEACGSI